MDALNPDCLQPQSKYISVVLKAWYQQFTTEKCMHGCIFEVRTHSIILMCLFQPLWHHRLLISAHNEQPHTTTILKGSDNMAAWGNCTPTLWHHFMSQRLHRPCGVTRNPSIIPPSTHAIHANCIYNIPQVSHQHLSFFCYVDTEVTLLTISAMNQRIMGKFEVFFKD